MLNNIGYMRGSPLNNRLKKEEHFRLSIFGICILFVSIPIMPLKFSGVGILMLSSMIFAGTTFMTIIFSNGLRIAETWKYFMLFFGYCMIIAYLVEGDELIPQLLRYVLLITIISFCTLNYKERTLLNWFICLTGMVVALYAINNPYYAYESRLYIDFFGVVQDPNYFTSFFILPTIIAFQMVISSKKRRVQFLSIISIGIMLYLVISTGSRGGVISICIAIIVMTIVCANSIGKKALYIIMLSLSFVMFIYLFSNYLPADLLGRYSLSRVFTDKGSGRLEIWIDYIAMIFNSDFYEIIFGHGVGSTVIAYGSTHNQILTCIYELGIIGGIIFIYLMVRLMLTAWKYKNKAALAVYIGYAVQIMSVSITTERYFWLNMAITTLWMLPYKNHKI